MNDKQTEALKLALEALEQYEKAGLSTLKTIDAIVSLREALAEQAAQQQEPVAWRFRSGTWFSREIHWRYIDTLDGAKGLLGLQPLYTSPPAAPAAQEEIQRLSALVRAQQITIEKLESQRQWVGLTDEQIQAIAFEAVKDNWDWLKFARAIEAKLREKNT